MYFKVGNVQARREEYKAATANSFLADVFRTLMMSSLNAIFACPGARLSALQLIIKLFLMLYLLMQMKRKKITQCVKEVWDISVTHDLVMWSESVTHTRSPFLARLVSSGSQLLHLKQERAWHVQPGERETDVVIITAIQRVFRLCSSSGKHFSFDRMMSLM